MADDDKDALPPLPAFLDRKKWTEEMWQRSARKHAEVKAQIEAELDELAQKAKDAKEAKKAKEAADAIKAQEKKETLARREAKRVLRNATLAFVRRALDKGPVTTNALRQNATENTKSLVPWALRTMLKTHEIEKVSRQTYKRRVK